MKRKLNPDGLAFALWSFGKHEILGNCVQKQTVCLQRWRHPSLALASFWVRVSGTQVSSLWATFSAIWPQLLRLDFRQGYLCISRKLGLWWSAHEKAHMIAFIALLQAISFSAICAKVSFWKTAIHRHSMRDIFRSRGGLFLGHFPGWPAAFVWVEFWSKLTSHGS